MDSWVLLVVVVVVVVVNRVSGPVSGIGSTRSFFGVHLGCFCVYFSSSSNIVYKHIMNVRESTGRQAFFIVFEGLNSGGGCLGFLFLLLF